MESSWCSHKYKNNVLILCKYWARVLNELWLCLHHQLFLISRASVTAKCVAGIKYSKVHFWIVCKKKKKIVMSDCLGIFFFLNAVKLQKMQLQTFTGVWDQNDGNNGICFELASWHQASWVLSPVMTLMGALLSHQLILVGLLQVHWAEIAQWRHLGSNTYTVNCTGSHICQIMF